MNNPKVDKFGTHYYNDKAEYHREDGPAVEWYDGEKWWCINGKYHREDGPAREWNGDKEWWYNDECIGTSWKGFTQEDFNRYLRSLKIKEYW